MSSTLIFVGLPEDSKSSITSGHSGNTQNVSSSLGCCSTVEEETANTFPETESINKFVLERRNLITTSADIVRSKILLIYLLYLALAPGIPSKINLTGTKLNAIN
ncbi:unnamed protein product [Arctia plantaginis]|uniref:Uncharacterized protein n=1 Tax=Arctia plantaginis TaxID=874455 RepID=A0A8S0ZID7_ARCPL|nr:unnamed protein product [Arctia plantaginis]CAB3238354.1 unnamed protein product [Arctia plantaginis]